MTEFEIDYARKHNPFARGTFDLTRQLEIKMSNPELAKELKASAKGVIGTVYNPWLESTFNFTTQMMLKERSAEAANALKEIADTYKAKIANATDAGDYGKARGELEAAYGELPEPVKTIIADFSAEIAAGENGADTRVMFS